MFLRVEERQEICEKKLNGWFLQIVAQREKSSRKKLACFSFKDSRDEDGEAKINKLLKKSLE